MKVDAQALLICTSLTTLVLYIFQVTFGVNALEQYYELADSFPFNDFEKGGTVGMKMIGLLIFLFFSVFTVLGLTVKVELLWANILGYALLMGAQMYGTLASFDTANRGDFEQVPNYCLLLNEDNYITVSDKNLAFCRVALASGFFIMMTVIASLFLTVRILQNSVRASNYQMARPVQEEMEVHEAKSV